MMKIRNSLNYLIKFSLQSIVLYEFKKNFQATGFFKVIQYGYETFQNVKPVLLNHITKVSEAKFTTNI